MITGRLGKDLDPFDLICHIAFDAKPLTRREAGKRVKRDVFANMVPRQLLEALLEKYADEGIISLDDSVLKIAPFEWHGKCG
jgi:type I restriction enzyme R subunit